MEDEIIKSSVLRVLGITGSLRAKSYNRFLLSAAKELAPSGMQIDIFDIGDVPLYHGDIEEQGDPAPVAAFKEAILNADALFIVTPEYNYGVPGVLKNSIDWASRPPGKSALAGKPVAITGASPGSGGTKSAQLQLRQTLAATRSLVLVHPEVFVANAHQKFGTEGLLTDEETRKHLRQLLDALAAWTFRLK